MFDLGDDFLCYNCVAAGIPFPFFEGMKAEDHVVDLMKASYNLPSIKLKNHVAESW